MNRLLEWIKGLTKKELVIGIITICVIAVVVVSVVLVLEKQEPIAEQVEETETQVLEAVFPEDVEEETQEEEAERDFASLKEQNEDIYAWLTVPGTEIDYPILQCEEDNFYLTHNLEKKYDKYGSIYSNASCNGTDFKDYNTILYGHNMRNGSMFAGLHKYEDESFFEENPYFYIETEQGENTYQIIAAAEYTDVYIPAQYDMKSSGSVTEFLKSVCSGENADGNINMNETIEIENVEHIVTLSTCISGKSTKRYLVIGTLLENEK